MHPNHRAKTWDRGQDLQHISSGELEKGKLQEALRSLPPLHHTAKPAAAPDEL